MLDVRICRMQLRRTVLEPLWIIFLTYLPLLERKREGKGITYFLGKPITLIYQGRDID